MNNPVRMAMVGGGPGAFIGRVHLHAASLDQRVRLVAGWLSRDPEKARQAGLGYGLDPDRAYASLEGLLEGESALPPERRAELISIVTPNHVHYDQARACLTAGFHVLVEKPMTMTSQEGVLLAELAREKGLVCSVMYNYTGYPMVREARERVRRGDLGTIRKVFVEYHQGWLSEKAEEQGVQQAEWRTDPARAGLGGALGDIGSHAENLVSFVTGLGIESLCADLTSFVPGRALDDDASVLLRFSGGAKGVLTASQICAGEGNGLTLRIYGDKGGLRWKQEQPERLDILPLNAPAQTIVRGGSDNSEHAAALSRIPVGHPEGFIEAFANIYKGTADLIRDGSQAGSRAGPHAGLTPGAGEGARGVRFIELCVESAKAGSAWTDWSD